MRYGQIQKLIGRIIMYILLIILAVLMVYPLLWMIAASFRPNLEIFTSIGLIVKNPVWNSYIEGWKSVGDINFTTYFLNTFRMVVPTVILTMVSSFITAYGFSRFNFKGKSVFFSMMIACLLLPQEVLIVPKYLLYNKFGWLNTYLPFIVPAGLDRKSVV